MKERDRRGPSRVVAEVVCKHGPLTMDELQKLFPHRSRSYLQKTLSNAKRYGMVDIHRHNHGGHGMAEKSLWGAPKYGNGLVSSVWDLAEPRDFIVPATPGTRYAPLGDWNAA
jgi:hypothetical protein